MPKPRALRAYQEALARLCQHRADGNTYRIARLATHGAQPYRDLMSGVALPPGVDPFDLTADDAEALRRLIERPARPGEPVEWKCLYRGLYQSTDGRWTIRNNGFNAWWVYLDGKAELGWQFRPYPPYWTYFAPFGSARDAKLAAETYRPPGVATGG